MIRYVHSYSKFEKMLCALKTSEKMAVSAAKKADEVIENILKYGRDTPLSELGKLTRHGESRIENCQKFDLGKGYRMVCVKNNDSLYLLFVGTHDDCYAWIENNRNFTPDPDRSNTTTHIVSKPAYRNKQDIQLPPQEPDYEDYILEKITDGDLKIVFKGLLEPANSASH